MSDKTTFNLAQRYLVMHANVMARGHEWKNHWSKEFRVKYIDDFYANFRLKSDYQPINPHNLTKQELLSLGGSVWDEDTGLVLLPVWMLFHLPAELELTALSGETRVCKRDGIDADDRFGCLAYGVFVTDEPVAAPDDVDGTPISHPLTISNQADVDAWLAQRAGKHDVTAIKGKPPVGATYDDGDPLLNPVNVAWQDAATGELMVIQYYQPNKPR